MCKKGEDLLRRHFQEEVDDDQDPRMDCVRLRDPQARDTDPFGLKVNYAKRRVAESEGSEPKV